MKKLWITVGATTAGVLLAGGVAVAATGALAPQPEPEPTKTPVSIIVETPEPPVTPTPEPVVEAPAPEPVVEAPAPPPPAPPYSNSGQPLPFYPSSDPENAEGGQYADSSWCTSGSASTRGGVPVCD